jgi:CRISPR type IV-associated protein Csf1
MINFDASTLDPQDLTASSLWARAAGVAPMGPTWMESDTRCVLCGVAVPQGALGTLADKHWLGDSFNNRLDLKTDGRAICGHCQALWNKTWMQSQSKSYAVAGQGVFSLVRGADLARFIIDPPTAPYVAIVNTRQQAHMIWRTPVALPSQTHLQVRLDDQIVVIDRLRVLAAVSAWRTALRILTQCGKPNSRPFIFGLNLASTLSGMPVGNHGKTIRAHSDEGSRAMDLLDSLSMADWWALCSLREHDPDTLSPEKSELPARRPVFIDPQQGMQADEQTDEQTDEQIEV